MNQLQKYFITLLSLISLSREDCSYSNGKCVCKNMALNEVLSEIFEKMPSNESMTSVELLGVPYPEITCYLYPLHENFGKLILDIKINNCSVESIGNSTFTAFTNLEELDLSSNEIEDISFVQYLPRKLKKLSLRNNYITSIENVFSNLKHLKRVDFSNCKIHKDLNFLVFKDIYKLDFVNVSSNNLIKTNSSSLSKNIECVDISHNVIESFYNIPYQCIDTSYTSFASIALTNFDHSNNTVFFDRMISRGNKKCEIEAKNTKKEQMNIEINYLDLSFTPLGPKGLKKLVNVKILKKLILKNQTIPTLKKSDFDLKKLFYKNASDVQLDMSRCSIGDIEKYYFRDYILGKLNLSGNILKLLQDYTFENANFLVLDLSNSNIEKIESFTFNGLRCDRLNLSRNMLTSIVLKNISSLKEIDLSLNRLTTFDAKSLGGRKALDHLNLSNNLITSLSDTSLKFFEKILHLDIRNNKLVNIDALLSCTLKVKSVYITYNKHLSPGSFKNYNNNIKQLTIFNMNDSLDSYYFNGLLTLEELYFVDSNVQSVAVDSLNRLFSLEYLDSQNLFKHVTVLKRHMFKNLKSLRTLNLSSLVVKKIEDESFIGLQALRELNLSNNKLTNLSNKVFVGIGNLRNLNLSRNFLNSLPLGTLSGLELLEKLDISHNHIKEFDTGIFSDLHHLEYLDFSFNYLEKLNAEVLFSLENLSELRMNENRLTFLDYKSVIYDHSRLSSIDISNNMWNCHFLYSMLQSFKKNSITFHPKTQSNNAQRNVGKISCTDECNNEYCSQPVPSM